MLDSAASITDSAFPDEPFLCPACGQMLAPSCRVCVACKQSINPAEIQKTQPAPGAVEPHVLQPVVAPARFSWLIFFLVLSVTWLAALITVDLFGQDEARLLFEILPFISSLWVIFDAHKKHVARPLRWGLGTLLMWIVIFPWYLARRRTPQAPCSFVEGIGMPIALVVVLAASVLFILIYGPIK
jgi:hypothetical protein